MNKKIDLIVVVGCLLASYLAADCKLEDLYRSYESAASNISQSNDRNSVEDFNYAWAETFLDALKTQECKESPFYCIVHAETFALLKSTNQNLRALELCNNLLTISCERLNTSDFYFDRALLSYQMWRNNELGGEATLSYFSAAMDNIDDFGLVTEAVSFLRVQDYMLREMQMSDLRIENLKKTLIFFDSLDDDVFQILRSRYGVHDPTFLPEHFAGLYINTSLSGSEKRNEKLKDVESFLEGLERINPTYVAIQVAKSGFEDSCEYAIFYLNNLKDSSINEGYLEDVRNVGIILQECGLDGAAHELFESVISSDLNAQNHVFESILQLHQKLKAKINNKLKK